jgi:hypothetical protein
MEDALENARELAQKLLSQGGAEILRALHSQAPS